MKVVFTGPAWLLLLPASAAAAIDLQPATVQAPLAELRLPLDSLARGTEPVTRHEPTSLLALDSSLVRVSGSRTRATKEVHKKMPHQSWFALFTFAFLLKGLCMFSSLVGQVSPIPQVIRFSKDGDTGDADAAPFMSMLYGGFQWTVYGIAAFVVTGKSGFLVLVYSNFLAATLGLYYVIGFHRNCKNTEALCRLFIYYKMAAFFFSLQLIAVFSFETQNALFFCGLLSSVCGVIGAGALLTTMPQVVRSRCSSSINVPLLYCGIVSQTLWLMCGIMLRDPWITGPAVIGLLLAFVAFSLVLTFPRDPIMSQTCFDEIVGKSEATDEKKDMERHKSESPPVADAPIWGRKMLVPSWRNEQKRSYGTSSSLGETGGT